MQIQALMTSVRLWGGMLVAIPTAMPADPLTSRLGNQMCIRDSLKENRVGITVGKKLGKAVTRNRVRRRLREIYRLHESQFLPGYDLVRCV